MTVPAEVHVAPSLPPAAPPLPTLEAALRSHLSIPALPDGAALPSGAAGALVPHAEDADAVPAVDAVEADAVAEEASTWKRREAEATAAAVAEVAAERSQREAARQ